MIDITRRTRSIFFIKCPVKYSVFECFLKKKKRKICFAIVLISVSRVVQSKGGGVGGGLDVVDTSFRDSAAISRGEKRVGIKNCTPYWESCMRLIN